MAEPMIQRASGALMARVALNTDGKYSGASHVFITRHIIASKAAVSWRSQLRQLGTVAASGSSLKLSPRGDGVGLGHRLQKCLALTLHSPSIAPCGQVATPGATSASGHFQPTAGNGYIISSLVMRAPCYRSKSFVYKSNPRSTSFASRVDT
jgi:hypothetical protein